MKSILHLLIILLSLNSVLDAKIPLNACTLLEPGIRLRMYTPLSDLKIISELQEFGSIQTQVKIDDDSRGFIHIERLENQFTEWQTCDIGKCKIVATDWITSGRIYRNAQGDTLFWNDRPSDKEIEFKSYIQNDTTWVWERDWSESQSNPWRLSYQAVWNNPNWIWIQGNQNYLMGHLSNDTCYRDSSLDKSLWNVRGIYSESENILQRFLQSPEFVISYHLGQPSVLTLTRSRTFQSSHSTSYRLNDQPQTDCSGLQCLTLRPFSFQGN